MFDEFLLKALVEEQVLTSSQIENATRLAAEQSLSVPNALVSMGMITARRISLFRALTCECAYLDLAHYEINILNAGLMPKNDALRHRAFPLFCNNGITTVGMYDPLDLDSVDQLRALLGTEIDAVICEPEALDSLIDRAYSLSTHQSSQTQTKVITEQLTSGDEPMVAAVNQILLQAMEDNASDVHINPDEHELHLRFRIDGTLQKRPGPGLAAHTGIVQRLKVMAQLDLTQTRRPQDGKFRFTHTNKHVDIRISIIPTVCGENVVMRLLAGCSKLGSFEDLGFSPDITPIFEECFRQPHGMVLITGPTGSGKTTTLYSMLKQINSIDTNIITVEDPVEIRLPLIRQVQVHAEIGMTFANALRSILRQDPDVVLIGEVRDEETARIALQAAMTGHLVLTTLHTNDAPGAIARLRDFNCPSFAINSSLLCVLAQRLVKRICASCQAKDKPSDVMKKAFGLEDNKDMFVTGKGCQNCMNTGYKGRLGVYELLRMSPAIRDAIDNEGSTAKVREAALADGMIPMWKDGLNKAKLGMTTLDEIARVVAVRLDEDGQGLPAADSIDYRMSA